MSDEQHDDEFEMPDPDASAGAIALDGEEPEDFESMAERLEGLPDPEGGFGEGDEESVSFGPERGPMRQQMVDAAVGRMEAEQYEKETRQILQLTEKMRGGPTNAYFEIRRVGPVDLPSTERGKVGRIRITELRTKAVDEVIEERYGGGEYLVMARRGNHEAIEGGVHELEIAGDPKMVSVTGQNWLSARRGPNRDGGSANSGAEMLMVREMMTSMREMMVTRESSKEGGDRNSMLLYMESQKEEREQRRLDEKKKDEERKDERERLRREEDDRRNEERAARAVEIERERADRAASLDRERRESDQKFQAWLADQAAEREERRVRAETDRQVMLKNMESQAGGGLGLGVLKKVKDEIATLFIDQARDSVMGPTGDDSWEGTMKEVVRSHGGEFLGQFAGMLAQKQGAAAPQALPGGTDAEYEPEVEGDEGDGVAPQDRLGAAAAIANAKAQRRTVGFIRLITSELMAQGDARAAWIAPQDESGVTLTHIYHQMPGPFRVSLSQGWSQFVGSLPQSAQDEAAVIMQICRDKPEAVAWMNVFLQSGPWTVEQPEPEEVAQESSVAMPVVEPTVAAPNLDEVPNEPVI